jgi:hypothetical protein
LCELTHFDIDEIQAGPQNVRVHQQTMVTAVNANVDSRILLLTACNLVESSAMNFVEGVADETLAFPSLNVVLCQFVERAYFLYCGMRKRGQVNQWDQTIKLYTTWSQRRREFDLQKQRDSVAGQLEAASKQAAPIKPLGHSDYS